MDWAHVLFPELACERPRTNGHEFRQWVTRLERAAEKERLEESKKRAAEEARIRAKRKAKEEDEFYLSDEDDYFAKPQLRAKVRQSQATGLLELPPEVLTNIVELCTIADWKQLRRVHSRLAQLRFLNQKLFRSFNLTPDAAKLFMVERMPRSIMPFFSTIFMQPAMLLRTDIPKGHSVMKAIEDLKPKIDAVIKSGRALSVWTEFLIKISPGVRVVIKYPECHQEYYAGQIHLGPSPEPFLKLSTATLAASGCAIGALDVKYCTFSPYVSRDVPSWQSLNLNHLKSLNFSVALRQAIYRRVDSQAYVQLFAPEYIALLNGLLQKSRPTLQDLTIDMDASAFFDRQNVPELDTLRHLKLIGTKSLNVIFMGQWLTQRQSLRRLSFDGVRVGEAKGTLEDWKPVFDAIKDHPGKLFIHVEGMVISRHDLRAMLWFQHQVGEVPTKPKATPSDGSGWTEKAIYMLKSYLSGLAEWNSHGI